MHERADVGLAFMLRYENIAWYEAGAVRILDRRVYPAKTEFVVCKTALEVALAIANMVTQSAGPYAAAAMGMALAAFEAKDKPDTAFFAYLEGAARAISNARPTTAKRMAAVTAACLEAAKAARASGEAPDEAVKKRAIELNDLRYHKIGAAAKYLVDMVPTHGTVMTQCFGETIIGKMLWEAKKRGSLLKLICPETRPYFQGARLTASVAQDMGFDVTVITDNMPAHVMKAKAVDVYTSAADAICLDGHVVNKIGTFQIALAAKYWGIPYFVTGAPDKGHATIDTVTIEERGQGGVLEAMGARTAMAGVRGYYPAFDVTPPHLVSGVVTDKGVFSPYDLARYFEGSQRPDELPIV